ncbi:hypothetical protein [Phenylobacterium sp. J367]|uniref:hypothetical protein n=1 Tax=Phenylobacterium sp. J367 TaxID=2898435 RepID=UPI0021509FC9|nr:hypothetical protein [Phenylobacterium sp. J367]MCR5879875.1 hypothetical protein [Phenylobacterium sp. J367]
MSNIVVITNEVEAALYGAVFDFELGRGEAVDIHDALVRSEVAHLAPRRKPKGRPGVLRVASALQAKGVCQVDLARPARMWRTPLEYTFESFGAAVPFDEICGRFEQDERGAVQLIQGAERYDGTTTLSIASFESHYAATEFRLRFSDYFRTADGLKKR